MWSIVLIEKRDVLGIKDNIFKRWWHLAMGNPEEFFMGAHMVWFGFWCLQLQSRLLKVGMFAVWVLDSESGVR